MPGYLPGAHTCDEGLRPTSKQPPARPSRARSLIGGANGDGTVYSISTAGTERVLYNFAGNTDGANPLTGLINVKGTLYGETYFGGGYGCGRGDNNHGRGTVFALTP
ncbi:MAG: choice-of-anchor tandem repeat GloVer-containing protein [Candidatus Cybelea sp.]